MEFRCRTCSTLWPVAADRWRCRCGGVLDLDVTFTPPPRSALVDRGVDTTRYREVLPVSDEEIRRGSIGVGRTPLVELTPGTFLKCDHQLPTGSFKDRGAEILLAFAAANGVREVVVDSSGNSASAAAAHAARRGMAASIYAPSGGPLPKLAQIERYGATLHLVTGPREEVRAQALERIESEGAFYASHVENPFFHHGTKLVAYELVEQLGRAPDAVYVAVGNGSLLLGLHLGFREMQRGGWITTLPRLIAAQTTGYASLVGDVDDEAPLPLADGIAVRHPRRLVQIAEAVTSTKGEVVVVDASAIETAQSELAQSGVWVEPTGAVSFAARSLHSDRDDLAVCVGSGAGFKAP